MDHRHQAAAEEVHGVTADGGKTAAMQQHPDAADDGEHDGADRDVEADVEKLLAAPPRAAHARERPRCELRGRTRCWTRLQHALEPPRAVERRPTVRTGGQMIRNAAIRRQLAGGNRLNGVKRFVTEHCLLAWGPTPTRRHARTVVLACIQNRTLPRGPTPTRRHARTVVLACIQNRTLSRGPTPTRRHARTVVLACI